MFAAIAMSKAFSKDALRKYARINGGKNRHSLERFASQLELANTFVCRANEAPAFLAVRDRSRQPGMASPTGKALAELKADIVQDGFYRFADMLTLARRALDECPQLLKRIRHRFPLVLLDEAQDTNGETLQLLDRLFGEGVIYQRLGDQNQTLYEDDDLTAAQYWTPDKSVIPLNESRRFGVELAAFASRLTVRKAQRIEGVAGIRSRRTLILFDQESIRHVIPAYASEVRAHWGDRLSKTHEVWAVASRHSPSSDTRGDWPKTLVEYCPDYRCGRGKGSRHDSLCVLMRRASLLFETCAQPSEVSELIGSGMVELLRRDGRTGINRERISKRNLWATLSHADARLPLKVKRLVRDRILIGREGWNRSAWLIFCRDLRALLEITADEPSVTTYLKFVDDESVNQTIGLEGTPRTFLPEDDIDIKLGSIHSVKGKTVDALLIVESEVWRGSRNDMRAMDLATVLPHAFGLEHKDFSANAAQLSAATNVFVAATRPRELLACAVRKSAISALLVESARTQGWNIVDLCKR